MCVGGKRQGEALLCCIGGGGLAGGAERKTRRHGRTDRARQTGQDRIARNREQSGRAVFAGLAGTMLSAAQAFQRLSISLHTIALHWHSRAHFPGRQEPSLSDASARARVAARVPPNKIDCQSTSSEHLPAESRCAHE